MTWTIPEHAPRATTERIGRFLDAYGAIEFRHALAVVPLLRRDAPDECRIKAHDYRLHEQLRSIYRHRATHLASSPRSPFYPLGLAEDVQDLVVHFDAAKDQPLCFWHVALPSGLCYIVFELLDDGVIAGCVRSADQRIVNPRSF